MKRIWFGLVLALILLTSLGGGGNAAISVAGAPPQPQPRPDAPAQPAARSQPIIVDHARTNITAIPQGWIEAAKRALHIAYGHTSHGSQLTDGMSGLVSFANGGGLGLALPEDIFAWNETGADGALDLDDYAMGGDVGYYPQWVNNTRSYLGTPDPITGRGVNHPDVNVIIWSWCGQASGLTEQEMIDYYLAPMTQLEADYPGVTFVYMTGHSDGTGEEGNLHQRNQQIREYCIANNKVLYDFYDIELYDPDGNYYGDKAVNDNCDYDSDGNGSLDKNWALDWQNAHTEDVDWYSCSCAHSQSLNCNRKAYAAWWLWARLAGWDGGAGGPTVHASAPTAFPGQSLTYTVAIRDVGAPPTATVHMVNAVPAGLAYIPGTLAATAGEIGVSDSAARRAPATTVLTWTGVLTPTPVVTVTYAVSVTAATRQRITNTVIIAADGYPPITRTSVISVLLPADVPDLEPSFKAASTRFAGVGDLITYTVGVRNAGGPLSQTVSFTDTLPAGLLYQAGSLTATRGAVDDSAAPTLRWSGPLTPTPAVTITYAAVVTYLIPGSTAMIPHDIVNTATIAAPGYPPVARAFHVNVWWRTVYLPLVVRNR